MNYDTKHGHLTNGSIVYAHNPAVTPNGIVFNPTNEQYLECDPPEKKLNMTAPTEPAGEGKHWEQDGWQENDTTISKKWKAVDDPVVSKCYSVPDLFFWLRRYDELNPNAKKGQITKDWLDEHDLYTISVTTRVVGEENKIFIPTLQALQQAIGFTNEEIAEALEFAKTDAMPDQAS